MNRLIRALASVSGVQQDIQEEFEGSLGAAATLGAFMLMTALISSLTAGYAVSQAFFGAPGVTAIAIAGGSTWGVCVFCLDRLMILGIDKFASARKCVLQILIRVPFAIAISLIISKPIVLRLVQAEVLAELRNEARQAITEETQHNQDRLGYADVRDNVNNLRNEEAEARKRLDEEPTSDRYRNALEGEKQANVLFEHENVVQGDRLRRLQAELETEQQHQQISDNAGRIGALRQQISAANQTVQLARRRLAAAREEVAAARNEWHSNQQNQLADAQRRMSHESSVMDAVRTKLDDQNYRSEREIEGLNKPDLLRQYRALRRITSDPNKSDSKAIRSFETALDLLFLLLELTPIIAKAMAKPTPLDQAVRAREFAEMERITLRGNLDAAEREAFAQVAVQVCDTALATYREAKIDQIEKGSLDLAGLTGLLQEVRGLRDVVTGPQSSRGVKSSKSSRTHSQPSTTGEDTPEQISSELTGIQAAA